jgi:tyrosinase
VTVFSRRSFLAGVAAVPFVVWLEEQGFAQAATLTRFDATSPQGQAMLKIYAQAVGKMMAAAQTPEGKPISWLFQWYTHWVRSDRTKAQEIARVYPTPSPDKDLANEMWATCQAHDGSAAREPFFLPWHRMYVFYFERIIRKVSGDNTFTLPYWDYSTADVAKHGIIPKEFRLANDPILKSLFIKNRNAGGPQLPNVNAGQPIDRFAPGALATTALKQGTYLPQGSLQGFNRALDRGLHGNVHGLTGDGQNMGAVPWAARDPVFWMHHCNIDRLWASWNKNGGRNPGGSWLTQTFVFADENGRKVVGTVNDFKEIAALNYTYDRFEPAPKPFAPIMITESAPVSAAPPATTVAAVSGPVLLGAKMTRAVLQPKVAGAAPGATPGTKESSQAGAVTERASTLSTTKRWYLLLRGLSSNAPPGVLYAIHLDLPPNATPAQAAERLVGTINFFDAVPHPGHEGASVDKTRFISFDATEVVRALREKKQLSATPAVAITPIGRPSADAKPVIEEVSLVEE